MALLILILLNLCASVFCTSQASAAHLIPSLMCHWLNAWCILHVANMLQKISFRFLRCFSCEVLANAEGTYVWKSC